MENEELGPQAKAIIGFVTGWNFSHQGCAVLGGMIMPPDWEAEPYNDATDGDPK